MGKGLGVAALILAVVAIFTPVIGVLLSVLALILATLSALAGNRVFPVAVPLIVAVNTLVLSPSVWMMLYGGPGRHDNMGFLLLGIVLVAAPLVGMGLHSSGKIRLGETQSE